jgi:hypothetical protein
MSAASRLEQLLAGLEAFGFEIAHREPEQAVLRRTDTDATYTLTADDSWVAAMQMILEAGELTVSKHAPAAIRFALELHGRYLGCRFGFDEDENLCAQYDIYPDMSAEHVALALTQMAYVSASTTPLFELVLAGGTVDDRLIERAFAGEDDAGELEN